MERKIFLTLFIFLSVLTSFAELSDSTAIELKGIEVKGQTYERRGDHDVVFMLKENRDFGSNALEAISSLNRFRTNLGTDKLELNDSRPFTLLIDGVPASAGDLKLYQGDDIKFVEYYDEVPAKFKMFASNGVLVNVIVKRRPDWFYQGTVQIMNYLATPVGKQAVGFVAMDSVHKVIANVGNHYNNLGGLDQTLRYDYGHGVSSFYDNTDGRQSGLGQDVLLQYQMNKPHDLFNVKFYLGNYKGHVRHPGSIIFSDGDEDFHGASLRDIRSNERALNLNMYYHHRFSDQSAIAVNVTNNLGTSDSRNVLWQKYDPKYAYMDFSTENAIDNNIYDLSINVLGNFPLFGGTMSVRGSYMYDYLKQKDASIDYTPSTHLGSASVSWNKSLSKSVYFYASLGTWIYDSKTSVDGKADWRPSAYMSVSWNPQGKLKGLSGDLSLGPSLNVVMPSELTDSRVYLDRHLFSTGNPELVSSYCWQAWASITYRSTKNNNYISFRYSPSFQPDFSPQEIFHTADGEVMLKRVPFKNVAQHNLRLNGSWYPVKWLEVSPYLSFGHVDFCRESGEHRKYNSLGYGGQIMAHSEKWAGGVYASGPGKIFWWPQTTYYGVSFGAVALYKVKHWAFTLRYNYTQQDNKVRMSSGSFSSEEWSAVRPYAYQVQLTVSWYFNKGKAKRQDSMMLNGGAQGSGFRESGDNKAKGL